MRQTLTKGLVVAAAATSALTLSGTWAFADSGPQATGADSHTVLSGDTAPQQAIPGESSALRAIARAQAALRQTHREAGYTAPASDSPTTKASDQGYGSDDDSSAGSTAAGSTAAGSTAAGSTAAGSNSAGSNSGYGDDEPGYGSSCACYGEDTPTPPPTKAVPPPPRKHTPAPKPVPVKAPPVKRTPPPPELAKTGTETTSGAMAASGALLAAGTVLYRRGRAAARR
ncbi:LPXTG cell wall anchor domain-containing protein [Streptomyces sp. NPDC007205]|uniref:LPXTG cell wall anchor domain-containing protein n=1 Tax=Streptomyces sp. NPDC007205 TaxID=3154316 RepID=UPI0033DEFA89